jgi:ferritin
MKNELINGKTLKEVVARYVETNDVKGFADFFWAREYDNQSHKERLIKEVVDECIKIIEEHYNDAPSSRQMVLGAIIKDIKEKKWE